MTYLLDLFGERIFCNVQINSCHSSWYFIRCSIIVTHKSAGHNELCTAAITFALAQKLEQFWFMILSPCTHYKIRSHFSLMLSNPTLHHANEICVAREVSTLKRRLLQSSCCSISYTNDNALLLHLWRKFLTLLIDRLLCNIAVCRVQVVFDELLW